MQRQHRLGRPTRTRPRVPAHSGAGALDVSSHVGDILLVCVCMSVIAVSSAHSTSGACDFSLRTMAMMSAVFFELEPAVEAEPPRKFDP